jgi:hypothetical protein
MTMDAVKPEKPAQVVTEITAVEGKTVGEEASSMPPLGTGELGSDRLAPLLQKVVAPPIAECERLIGQLQEARTYLHSEGERIQRETDRYIQLAQTASESIRIISGAIRDWREAGHPPQ